MGEPKVERQEMLNLLKTLRVKYGEHSDVYEATLAEANVRREKNAYELIDDAEVQKRGRVNKPAPRRKKLHKPRSIARKEQYELMEKLKPLAERESWIKVTVKIFGDSGPHLSRYREGGPGHRLSPAKAERIREYLEARGH